MSSVGSEMNFQKFKTLKRRTRFLIGCTALCLPFWLASPAFISLSAPDSPAAVACFDLAYVLAPNKNIYLTEYDEQILERRGGYLPDQIDDDLCERLKTAKGAEYDAIVDFFALKAGGRDSRDLFALSDVGTEQIIANLMKRLDTFSPDKADHSLIFIETLRQGKRLGKANIFSFNRSYSWPNNWEEHGLPEAKRLFRKWWNNSGSWQQKRKRDPLAGSVICISAP
jgi:hypothetical protein